MNSKIYIMILIIGIILIGGWWIWEECAYSEPLERTLPYGLIVASRNGLVNLVYNPSNQTYEKQAEIILPGIRMPAYPGRNVIVSCDNYIFVSTKDEVLRLNSKFEKLGSKKFEEIGETGALATDKKNIFISAENSFIALDKNLRELSRVELDFYSQKKNAHDILIYKNTAYLLDNIMLPLFLFRVNIEDPKNIQIIEEIKFGDVNAHLVGQWLNPELGQWLVIQSFSHVKHGEGLLSVKKIHIYPMKNGKAKLATQRIFKKLFRYTQKEELEGLDIRGITNLPPIWAIVQDVEGRYYLAQVSSDDNKISFSNVLDLDGIEPYRYDSEVIIKHKDNYLFIVPERNALLIIDVEQRPKVVLSKNLKEFNVRTIIDILPY